MIDNKYLTLQLTKHSWIEDPCKLYMEWYSLKRNPKLKWVKSKEFCFFAGIFGLHFIFQFRWGFIDER